MAKTGRETEWQLEIIERVANMDNRTLLDETLFAAVPDDYDGYFSKRGLWKYNYMAIELYKRLFDAGVISSVNRD